MTAVTPATPSLAETPTGLAEMPAALAEVLARRSLRELGARERALAVLDPGSARELVGPFDGVESPWLEPQGLVPQADDGVVVVRGTVAGQRTVVVAVEQGFQGGAVGEVSGARISEPLRLAAADGAAGRPTAGVLLLETGGVRLQEANLGLAAVAEICDAVLALRRHAPVIAVVAGDVGCFGGVSIALGLCTEVVVTRHARVGLNGPAVVELEAGRTEFDSADRRLVWAVHGAAQRRAQGLVDHVVPDDAPALRDRLAELVAAGPATPGTHRSERVDVLAARLAALDPATRPGPDELSALWGDRYEITPALQAAGDRAAAASVPAATHPATGRGATWLRRLGGSAQPQAVTGSVLVSRTEEAVHVAVVADPSSPYPRARQGEVGLRECLALARTLHGIRAEDAAAGRRRPIVAVVDLPSQAYGLLEETAGLHAAIATAVDAYAACRADGHPVVALVVGTALSGGFLTHGLQAGAILALDDPGVEIHAMHKPAAARITRRTVDELDRLAGRVPPLSYDVRTWATLGLCDGLVPVTDADDPSDDDVATVRRAVAEAVSLARSRGTDLSYRLDTTGALRLRAASRSVRDLLAAAWADPTDPTDPAARADRTAVQRT
jgi:malonate decarboxylase beta subunit